MLLVAEGIGVFAKLLRFVAARATWPRGMASLFLLW
jgi:hypothetical protein